MSSNFALSRYVELAQKSGYSYNDALSGISKAILLSYYQEFSNAKKDARVVLDGLTGQVNLLSDNTDITPKGFQSIADNAAKNWLLENTGRNTNVPVEPNSFDSLGSILSKIIFWGYNSIFLLAIILAAFGLTDQTTRQDTFKTLSGFTPLNQIGLLFLLGTPFFSIFKFLTNRKINLAKLFFMFEIPNIIVSLINLASSTNPIPPFFVLQILMQLLPLFLFSQSKNDKPVRPLVVSLRLFFNQVYFSFAIYLSSLLIFFLPLIIRQWFDGMFSGYYGYDLAYYITSLLLRLIPSLLILFIILLPYIIAFIFGRLWYNSQNQHRLVWGSSKTWLNIGISLAFTFIVFLLINYQPNQNNLLNLLSKVRSESTYEARAKITQQLLSQQKKVRDAVLDSVNYSRRYPLKSGDTSLLTGYQYLGVSESLSTLIQNSFLVLARPFVYRGQEGNYGSADDYQYLFGKSVYDNLGNNFTYQSTNYVTVTERNVTAKTGSSGLTAEISIEDKFSSSSYRSEEIVYEFSLPPGSVVTDLKLGPDLEFPGLVAPKGAAAKTFQAEVNRGRDPALLEQVGPNQYRLRVFPIPGRNDTTILKGKPQKVKFTYIVAAEPSGYRLPLISKLTNLKFQEGLQVGLKFDGKTSTITTGETLLKVAGLKDKICGTSNVNSKELFSLAAEYNRDEFVCDENNQKVSALAKGKNIAILLDTSATSSKDVANNLQSFLRNNKNFWQSNKVTLYRFNDLLSEGVEVNQDSKSQVTDITNFGPNNWLMAVKNLPSEHQAVIIISNKLLKFENTTPIQDIKRPLYFVLVDTPGISLPQKVHDYLLETKGSITNIVSGAINQYVMSSDLENQYGQDLASVGNFLYFRLNGRTVDNWFNQDDSQINSIIALGAVRQRLNAVITLPDSIQYLDQLHNFSVERNIVTPYSSLIALVNETQIQNLINNIQGFDRYDELQSNNQIVMPTLRSGSGMSVPIFGGTLSKQSMSADGAIMLRPSGGFSALGSSGGSDFISIIVIVVAGSVVLFGVISIIYYAVVIKKRRQRT